MKLREMRCSGVAPLVVAILCVVGAQSVPPFAGMVNSDDFMESSNPTLWATVLNGTSLSSFDAYSFYNSILLAEGCRSRIVVCCPVPLPNVRTCANALPSSTNTLVVVELFPPWCVVVDDVDWKDVTAAEVFTGSASRSSIDGAIDAARSSTGIWIFVFILIIAVITVLICCWRRKVMQTSEGATRRQLPHLGQRDEVVYAAVPRPGTSQVLRDEIRDEVQLGQQYLENRGRFTSDVQPKAHRDAADVEMVPAARSALPRATTRGPLPRASREEESAHTAGAGWDTVIPSTSLFPDHQQHQSRPDAASANSGPHKGDDLWVA